MLMRKFNFQDLFVFDLANNHQGDLLHGMKIIDHVAAISEEFDLRSAIKFQFRDLPAFIRKDLRAGSSDVKHINRFLSTALSWDEFKELANYAREKRLLTMCTPFDERSCDKIKEMGFDIVKVASCSAKDWPLLDYISAIGLPVIASTGGLVIEEVDDLVSFFTHRASDFALMHCVSVYPTPDHLCNLNNVADFCQRYPDISIGWSTHESPGETMHIGLAYALGARIFERHVALESNEYSVNAYSSQFKDLREWIAAYHKARRLLGVDKRQPPCDVETKSIEELERGVFARVPLKAGAPLSNDNVYFAFPKCAGGISS